MKLSDLVSEDHLTNIGNPFRSIAFKELAEAQRGVPELAMLDVQRANVGGVLSYVVEHVGDLTHRMCQPPSTLVETPDGTKFLGDIHEGDAIIGYDPSGSKFYKNRRVLGVTKRHYTGHLVTIITSSAISSYTPEHLLSNFF